MELKQRLAVIGPGIFAIGYTIGIGSVTSMVKAGSQYGLQLLWVLVLSGLFSGVLMEAYGRMAAVTGDTALHAVKRHLPFVLPPLAVAVIIALVNRRALMGEHRAGPLLNAGLALAGLFACIIAATGLRALLEAWLG